MRQKIYILAYRSLATGEVEIFQFNTAQSREDFIALLDPEYEYAKSEMEI
jgi:hypothetical protein